MKDLKGQFGKRIKTLRKQKRMTQEQLAEASNISVDFLSLVERGKSGPSFEVLERLAGALGVPVKDLFDFDR